MQRWIMFMLLVVHNFAIHDHSVGPEGAIVLNSGLKNIYTHLLYKAHSRFWALFFRYSKFELLIYRKQNKKMLKPSGVQGWVKFQVSPLSAELFIINIFIPKDIELNIND